MLCHLQLQPKGGTGTERGPKTTRRSPASVPRAQHLVLLPTPLGKTPLNRELWSWCICKPVQRSSHPDSAFLSLTATCLGNFHQLWPQNFCAARPEKGWSPRCWEPMRELSFHADFALFSPYDQPGIKPGCPLPFIILPCPIRSSHPELALPGGTLTLSPVGAHMESMAASPFQTPLQPHPAPKRAEGTAPAKHPSLQGSFQGDLDALHGGKCLWGVPKHNPRPATAEVPLHVVGGLYPPHQKLWASPVLSPTPLLSSFAPFLFSLTSLFLH